MSPIRNLLAHKLTEHCGVFDLDSVGVIGDIEPATEEDLLRVHRADFIESVKLASKGDGYRDLRRGLGTDDVPVFPGMHDAAALVGGATKAAAMAVHSGDALHAVNVCGGLHHAMWANASGFCVYNDLAVGIHWLLANGVDRVAYVDVDVHHGDGVQQIFYNDPRVLTVSIHESPRTLFPGTGYPHEVGGEGAKGTAVNLALPAGTADDGWLRAFEGVVPEVLAAFKPQVLFTQQGCDTHRDDPLAHLRLTIEGQRESYRRLHDLAHELCDGRWVATGGGGYDWLDVVPRAWTHLAAVAAGSPIDPRAPVPYGYRTLLKAAFRREAPEFMGDGTTLKPRPWGLDADPMDHLDKAVLKTRDAVFPLLGLEPDPNPF